MKTLTPIFDFFQGAGLESKYDVTLGRPTCINKGCGRPAVKVGKNAEGATRWRAFCRHCHEATWKKGVRHEPGVIPFKVNVCYNFDAHLGFSCTQDLGNPFEPSTHVHHKDGNHKHNHPDNLAELCKDCHYKLHRSS